MDLDSPFLQTVLIQEKTGEITEKEVRKGQIKEEVIEFEKKEGGLLILPRGQVLAVLPLLPQAGDVYKQRDAQKAFKLLREVQDRFSQRSEVSPATLAEWDKLASAPTKHERQLTLALDEWLKKTRQSSSVPVPGEIEKLTAEGSGFLDQFPDRAQEIENELKGLKELQRVDLAKIDAAQFELGPLGQNFLIGGALWAFLVVALVLSLVGFQSSFLGFREGRLLAGVVRLLIGGSALAFLVVIFWKEGEKSEKSTPLGNSSSMVAKSVAWFSLNTQEKWSSQTLKKVSLPAVDWLSFLSEKVVVGAGADTFPFWHLGKPEIILAASSIVLFQPVEAKVLCLPFHFVFVSPQPGQSLTELELAGASLGKIPFGKAVGYLVWQIFLPSYQPVIEKLGINNGTRWFSGQGDSWVVEIPEVKIPESSERKQSTPQAKESLSARELAEVFDQGFGKIYSGKIISVEGSLVEVSSFKETLGDGTKLDKQDPMDEFILEGIPQGQGRLNAFRVRCQFKSSEAYFMDSKGDLFRSAPSLQNPSTDFPILRKVDGIIKVRVSAGRVESKPTETRLITLYDCRTVEGFDGKQWVLIWGK